ncbi:hypothetical protein BH23PAT2_BH23PAT2_09530 [soil metagenome]
MCTGFDVLKALIVLLIFIEICSNKFEGESCYEKY